MNAHSFDIRSILRRNAKLFPDNIALDDGNTQTTFKELLDEVREVAGGLKAKGVVKGDRIALLSRNSDRFLVICFASAELGAIVVPINWRLSIDEIIYILSDSEPSILFFEHEFADVVDAVRSKCSTLRSVFVLNKDNENDASFISLVERAVDLEEEVVEGGDPFIICYTAAIWGRPRGAMLSHNSLIYCNIQTALRMGLTTNDTHLNLLPLYHMMDFAIALSVMHVGGKNVLIGKFDAESVLNIIGAKSISIFGSFPPILSKVLVELSLKDYDISSLKHVYGIEKPSVIEAFEKASNSEFWCLYGQTESMLACLCTSREKRGSAGRPGVFVDMEIVDVNDRKLPSGETGEIVIRSPMVFMGYWNEAELTKYTHRNGWHHTGDIGYFDEQGYLWFIGRKEEKELIKSGGENVYPVEVEQVLVEHPGIKEAVVFGVPDEEYGEGIKAVIVLNKCSSLSGQEVADFVAGKIGRYKRPRHVEFVSSLPKTDDGSIDRKRVKIQLSIKK